MNSLGDNLMSHKKRLIIIYDGILLFVLYLFEEKNKLLSINLKDTF